MYSGVCRPGTPSVAWLLVLAALHGAGGTGTCRVAMLRVSLPIVVAPKPAEKLEKGFLARRWCAMQAEKKKISVEDLTAKIVNGGGPASSGTKAEANKFHDDKSLYTGIPTSYIMLAVQ